MNILLNGASGRMGNEVAMRVEKEENMQIVAGIGLEEDLTGKFPIYSKIEDVKEKIDITELTSRLENLVKEEEKLRNKIAEIVREIEVK